MVSHITRKININMLWLTTEKIMRILLSLYITTILARYLGVSNYGVLTYVLAVSMFFGLFVDLGLSEIMVREIARKPKIFRYILGSGFVIKFCGALIAILFALSFYFYSNDKNASVIMIVAMVIGFTFKAFDVLDYFFQYKILSRYVSVAKSLSFFITSFLTLYFISNEYKLIYFIIPVVLDLALTVCFLIISYKIVGFSIFDWKFSKKISISLLRYSWPLILSAILITVHTKVDQIMIASMLSNYEVGLYGVSVKLYESWMFIPGVIISTFMPYLVDLRKVNPERYYFILKSLYSVMFWTGLLFVLFVITFGENIILFLFGQEYMPAYGVLVINMWIGIFISQGLVRGCWLINEGLQIYRLFNNILAVITNIGLNVLFIPKFGIEGAALASLVSIFLATYVFPLFFKEVRVSSVEMITSIIPFYLITRSKK